MAYWESETYKYAVSGATIVLGVTIAGLADNWINFGLGLLVAGAGAGGMSIVHVK